MRQSVLRTRGLEVVNKHHYKKKLEPKYRVGCMRKVLNGMYDHERDDEWFSR